MLWLLIVKGVVTLVVVNCEGCCYYCGCQLWRVLLLLWLLIVEGVVTVVGC